MTPEEVIESLKYLVSDDCTDTQADYREEIETAVKLLEKQIPKKPFRLDYKLLIDDGWTYGCPNCKCACGQNKYTNYEYIEAQEPFCGQCGQAIDWSDSE